MDLAVEDLKPNELICYYNVTLEISAFSVAALTIWNSLPANIRLCHNCTSTFKRHLKLTSLVPPSLPVPPLAPLYLWTLWRYTNASVLLLLLLLLLYLLKF